MNDGPDYAIAEALQIMDTREVRRTALMLEAFNACHELCETCDHNLVVAPVNRPWDADATCTGTPSCCPVIKEFGDE